MFTQSQQRGRAGEGSGIPGHCHIQDHSFVTLQSLSAFPVISDKVNSFINNIFYSYYFFTLPISQLFEEL